MMYSKEKRNEMKRLIIGAFLVGSAIVANAQTDSLCLCKLNLASPDVKSKLKLVKTKAIGKPFKGEKDKPVEAHLYKLTYKYNSNGVSATFVTKRLASAIDENQYAETIIVKVPVKGVDILNCHINGGKKTIKKYINCTE